LQRVINSGYERLEIIVLDDVSGDDTSALIKSFASEGVRFVKGSQLEGGWLGKNHALQGLLKEASGSYVLFMDVDTVLAPNAVENMVRYAVSHRASMMSVLPRREDGWRASVVASPLRYLWELLFWRRNRPATASNAWLIRREVLETRFGGFKTLKNVVQPEATIAAELSKTGEYRFLVGTKSFGVAYEKKWRSQLATSVRLLYPSLDRRPLHAVAAVLGLLLLLIPVVVLLYALWAPVPLLHAILSGILYGGFALLYGVYVHHVWRHGWLVAALFWPLIVLQEVILIIASGIQYSRRTVKWKGRVIRPEA
jgi:chlorobactene glucosyltransferase